MLRTGDKPTTFSLNTYAGTTYYMDQAHFTNKVTLLSFVDINDGWDWLHHMKNLRAFFPVATVNIVAVIFDHTGFVYEGAIDAKFPDPNLVPADLMNANMPVCMDGDWATSVSRNYSFGFDNTNDPSFHSNAGVAFWSYIISESFYITDKWNYNCTTVTNQDPISFRQFTAGGVAFNSQDFPNTENYVKQRITNLLAAPSVLSIQPVEGFVSGLTQVKVAFSKPMGSLIASPPTEQLLDITSIKTKANYAFSGGATEPPGSIDFAATNPIYYENSGLPTADPKNAGKVENVVTLNLNASLTDTNLDKTAVVTVTTNITDTQTVPLPPAQRDIVYDYDVTPPLFSSFTLTSGTPTANPNITFNLTVTDNVGVTGWQVNESSTPPSASGGGWTTVASTPSLTITGGTYTLSGGNGTKHIYAWAKDAAGNVSAVTANSHFDVVYDTDLPQVTGFTRSSASPTNNPVIAFHITGTDNMGIVAWKVTETSTKPSSGGAGWNIVAETTSLSVSGTYTLSSTGTTRNQTLYVWLSDGSGNVSDLVATSHFEVYYDVTPPVVTSFVLTSPNPTNSSTITFNLVANDPA